MTTKYVTKTIPIEIVFDKYKGKSINEIVREFGPPDKKNSKASGGVIYTYENNSQFAYQNNFKYSSSYTNGQEQTYFVDLFFNIKGDVYYYRTNYPDVVEKLAVGKTLDYGAVNSVITLGLVALGMVAFVDRYQ